MVRSAAMARTRILHVLWAPNVGPFVGYWNPSIAWSHARTMAGVQVEQIEVREELPPIALEDISAEFDGDDETPRVVDVPIEDLDDG